MRGLADEAFSVLSGDEVDYVQVMLGGKEDEMDVGTCSESYQDSDVDVSEFPGDLLLSFCCG